VIAADDDLLPRALCHAKPFPSRGQSGLTCITPSVSWARSLSLTAQMNGTAQQKSRIEAILLVPATTCAFCIQGRNVRMKLGTRLKTSSVAAMVSVGLLGSTIPVEAQGLRTGFLSSLIGGVALGAFAASARSAQNPAMAYGAELPVEVDGAEFWQEEQPRILAPAAAPVRQQARRPSARRQEPAGRASSAQIESCRRQIASSSRPLGAVAVQATSAGPTIRDRNGALLVPLNARIEYARNGMRQVRQARVNCQVRDGQVVAFR
jgi:hypothetical protein